VDENRSTIMMQANKLAVGGYVVGQELNLGRDQTDRLINEPVFPAKEGYCNKMKNRIDRRTGGR
jgi:hypothetical protein